MEHIQPLTASQACRAPMAQQKKGRSMRPFCLQGWGPVRSVRSPGALGQRGAITITDRAPK
jgi:hypothetical protein